MSSQRMVFAAVLSLASATSLPQAGSAQLLGKFDPVKIVTGRSIEEQFERRAKRLGRAVEKFAHDPLGYIASRPQSLASDICASIPRTYEGVLRGRVTQWHGLSDRLVQVLQPHYPEIDLSSVRYALNAPTANGAAQAFGTTIYFPNVTDWHDWYDLRWLLHELEHVVQYQMSSAGKSGKLCEYVWKSVGGLFDPANHDWEQAADRKADYLIGIVFPQLVESVSSSSSGGEMPNSTIFGHWDPDTYLYFGDPFGNGPPTFLFANQIVVVNQSAFHWDVNIASPSISGWLAFPPQSSRIVQTYGGESSFTFSVPNGVNPPTTYSLAGGRRYAIRCYPPPNACHLEYW